MVYLVTGHIFQLAGIFFAFLAAGISFYYAFLIKGGLAGKAALLNSVGYLILAINIFLIYSSAITGNLDLLNVTFFWPLLGLLTLIGFGIIAYSQFKLLRLMGGGLASKVNERF
jgi:hypothetical protein